MSTQKLVREGIRWRVGNGRDISVWGDKWLPSPSTFKVVSPRQFLHQDTKVSELIDMATASWKFDILDALFHPHEAEMIKGILLSSHLLADKLIWAEASNGEFSVKSAYALEMRLAVDANQGTSSDRSQVLLFWNKLWADQYLTKYVTLHGGHAEIAFLLRKILCDVGWLRTKSVMNAGRMRSQQVTCSGHAQKLEKCGLALR